MSRRISQSLLDSMIGEADWDVRSDDVGGDKRVKLMLCGVGVGLLNYFVCIQEGRLEVSSNPQQNRNRICFDTKTELTVDTKTEALVGPKSEEVTASPSRRPSLVTSAVVLHHMV